MTPGGRLAATAAAAAALLFVSAANSLAANSYAVTSDQGVAAQMDPAHDGNLSHDTLTPPVGLAWSTSFGSSSNTYPSYPIIDNGKVFVTARYLTSSQQPWLVALNMASGATAWGPVPLAGPGWANLTLENGRLFVIDGSGWLQAFDENAGTQIWAKQLSGSFSAPPTASNGTIYISGATTLGGGSGSLYAVRETDGSVLWTASVASGEVSSPAVSSTGVYVSYRCGETYDFNPTTGALIWHHATACSGGGGKTPVLYSGRLYVRDATAGNLILDETTGISLGTFNGTVMPAFTGSRGFFKDAYGLTAVDLSTNGVAWMFGGDGALNTAPIIVNGYLYIASSKGNVYAINPSTGAAVQTWTIPEPAAGPDEQSTTGPLAGLAAGYGMLFVPGAQRVYAFGGEETLYPGDSDWGYQIVGQPTTPPAPFTLISNLPNGLAISSISTTGDYTQTNSCPSTLFFGASCVIGVTFTPSTAGSRPGTLTITDNASGSPHVIPLAGIGSPSGNPPDHLVLSPASITIAAGGSQTYHAEAFDRNNVDLGEVTGATSFALDGTGCGGPSCSSTKAGSHTVTGVYQGVVTGSAILTVTAVSLDHLTLSPSTAAVVAGATQSYVVEGFDLYGNDLGDVTPSSALSIAPDGTCANGSCTATHSGAHTVTATVSGKTATGSLTVNPGPLAAIFLNPGNLTVPAGVGQTYYLVTTDQYGNAIAIVSSGFGLTIGPPTMPCNGTTCSATKVGTYQVTASYEGLTATTAQTVAPGPLDYLALTPVTATVVAGGTQVYAVEGFDQYGNDRGSLVSSTFLSVTGGTCSGMSCMGMTAGNQTVAASSGGKTATAVLTVIPGPLARINVTPSTTSLVVGGTAAFSVTGTDVYNNPVGVGSVAWSVLPIGLGTLSSTTGTSVTFKANPLQSASGTIVAADGSLSSSAGISVMPDAPTKLVTVARGNAVVLNWNAAAGAKTYNVYRLATGGSWMLLKSGITTTTYKDATASGPFPFSYYVTAVGATGLEGGPSNTVSVTPR